MELVDIEFHLKRIESALDYFTDITTQNYDKSKFKIKRKR